MIAQIIPILSFFKKYWKFAVAIAAVVLAAYIGHEYSDRYWETKFAEYKLKLAQIENENQRLATLAEQITIKEVIRYIDRVKTVQGRTEEIIREIPVYIKPEDIANCIIPDDFVRLHNLAAAINESLP